MIIIGITGPSGAGKGVCGAYLTSEGIPVIDTDQLYHELIEAPSPCVDELALAFGSKILDEKGAVNRKALADVVFAGQNQQKIELLNQITHKFVRQKTERLLMEFDNCGTKAVAVDAPLLFEASFEELCDFCISVIAPHNIRLERIMERDSLSRERAIARLNAQKDDAYYTSRSKYTVVNDKDLENVIGQLKRILKNEEVIS